MRSVALIALAIGLAGGAAAAQPGPGPGSGAGAAAGSAIDLDPLVLGAPEVSAAASPSELRLGQPITLVVTVTYGAGVSVNLPDPLVLGDAFEAGHRETSDRVRSDGRRVREWQIKVYAWELGDISIPPVQVTFTAGGRAAVMASNAVPLRVIGVLGDADDPKLMRAMTPPVPLWRRDWALAFYAAGVVALLVAVVVWLGRRRRKRRARPARPARDRHREVPVAAASAQASDDRDGAAVPEPATAALPPFVPPPPTITTRPRRKLDRIAQDALARLRAIEASGRLDSDRRAAYRDMVEVIRDYLAARFAVDALELTTRELCLALTFRSTEAAGLTRAWLADCDLVKYANRSASGAEARAILDGACGLIDRTSPGPGAEAAHA